MYWICYGADEHKCVIAVSTLYFVTEINECRSSPCQNGGTCVNFDGGFNCTCAKDVFGPTCSQIGIYFIVINTSMLNYKFIAKVNPLEYF